MQLDKVEAIEKAEKYAMVVAEQFKPFKIVLYGSYAKNTWNENSDIDVAVIVDDLKTDFLDFSKELNKLTRDIDNRIEPVLLINNDDRSGFLTSILKSGIVLYQS